MKQQQQPKLINPVFPAAGRVYPIQSKTHQQHPLVPPRMSKKKLPSAEDGTEEGEGDSSPFALDFAKSEQAKTKVKVDRDLATGQLRYVISKQRDFTLDGELSGSGSSVPPTFAQLLNADPHLKKYGAPPLGGGGGGGKGSEKGRKRRKRGGKGGGGKPSVEKFHEEGSSISEEVNKEKKETLW